MREVVGQSDIQPLLTQARQKTETAVHDLMQKMLDSYGAGIQIDQVTLQKVDPPNEVIDAFRDVQAARADKERLQNEAFGYANKVVPEARGEAERILQGARATKQQTVAEARARRRASSRSTTNTRRRPKSPGSASSLKPWNACSAAPTRSSSTARRAKALCPICRSTRCRRSGPREPTDHARISRTPPRADRHRRRRRLCVGLHRAPERAGARARVRQAEARRAAARASTGSFRSSRRSISSTSASSISTPRRRRSPPPIRSVSSSTPSRATRSSIR